MKRMTEITGETGESLGFLLVSSGASVANGWRKFRLAQLDWRNLRQVCASPSPAKAAVYLDSRRFRRFRRSVFTWNVTDA